MEKSDKTNKLKIYNMDCMDLMKQYPDKFFDLAIVDPPYGIGEDGSKSEKRENLKKIDPRNGRNIKIYQKHYKGSNWDNNPPNQKYFDELFRVAKKVIIWGENYMNFTQKNSSSGRIFWNKLNGNNDFSDGEIAWTNLFTSTRKFDFIWNGMIQGKSVLEGHIQQGNKKLNETRIHPTQKPIALYTWLLNKYAKPSFKILDTHLGSGSHAIACNYFGADFVGCEKDIDIFNESLDFIKKETSQLSLFEIV